MRKLFIFLFLAFSISSFAQSSFRGEIADTASRQMLHNATVCLIRSSDSTLYGFDRTDKKGAFHFKEVDTGKYLMLVTYPGFADFVEEVVIQKDQPKNFGKVAMTPKAKLLDVVFVRSAGAIRIKGDTTEFVADSFKVKEGATVEELLKKLPGFQVNSKGEVIAQGQRVQKVLVDGEEFFGDDPTMATKNISAKAVDKVQIYDTKTDQQQLTGMVAGNEGKTVNIKLKEDHKKGAFGKAEVGVATNDITDFKALYNRFVGKQKMSVFGTKSKINTGALMWNERRSLGFENDYEYDEISGIAFSYNTDSEFENWNLRGLPDAYTFGGLYIDKWDNDRKAINANYKYNRLSVKNDGSTFSQTILPDTLYYSNKFTYSSGLKQQHALNAKYEWFMDSLTSFKLTMANAYNSSSSFANTYSESLNEEKQFVNTSNRVNNHDVVRLNNSSAFAYKQLFKKKNRQLMATLRFGATDNDQEGTLNFQNKYFSNGQFVQSDTSDQYKDNKTDNVSYGARVTFSEPLSAKWNLVTEYSYNGSNSNSVRSTFEKSISGKYEILNPAFSNDFSLKAFSHSGSVYGRYMYKKLRLSVGSGISALQLDLRDNGSNINNHYNFLNFTPQLAIGYQVKTHNNISINYKGNTIQPTIEQLQPIRDNNDPLNEFKGNPDLKVGFAHNISGYFHNYKVLAQRGFWFNFSFRPVQNAITNYNTVDSFGRRTYFPVNVNGNYNYWFWGELSLGEGENKLIKTIQLNGNGGRNINFVNGLKNRTNTVNIESGFGLRYESPEKYSFYVQPRLGWNHVVSSISSSVKNDFFTFGTNVEGSIMLPGKIEIATDLQLNLRQRSDAFGNSLDYTNWSATISRKVFPKNTGKILLIANDILQQNRGISRVTNSNFISEERYQMIGPYFMLKFEWSLNQMTGQ